MLTNLEDICRYSDILKNDVNFTDSWQKKNQQKAHWLSCFSRQCRAVQGSRKWRKVSHKLRSNERYGALHERKATKRSRLKATPWAPAAKLSSRRFRKALGRRTLPQNLVLLKKATNLKRQWMFLLRERNLPKPEYGSRLLGLNPPNQAPQRGSGLIQAPRGGPTHFYRPKMM